MSASSARLGRVLTAAGPRVAAFDQDLVLPPASGIPGVLDPPLERALPRDQVRLLPPVEPGKVLAIGRNYAAHARELGHEVPSRPLLFLKAASAVIGPDAPILLPPDSARVEHEAELGLVIGRRCRHVSRARWRDVVAGYTCVNDVTARDLQRADGQFARGKGFDTFCPIGPWIVPDLDRDVGVRCRVHRSLGVELRQDGHTRDLIFPLDLLIETLSRIMTLEPGDVIATGTPEGVGPLLDGDVVEVEIDGIGVLRNPVRPDPIEPLG